MTTQTHWMEYGEPTGNDRVEATKRVTYQTGPNERCEDDVIRGTLSYDALEVWEESEHVHEDGSLCLSSLDSETREFVESQFEEKHTDAINGELTDDEIADAINSQGGGGDHPNSITVREVRDALNFIARSAQEVWGTWMDNIENNDTEVVAETSDVLVVSTGTVNVVSEELDAMEYEGELNRDGEDRSILASIITNCMHKIARQHSGRNWSVDYPWVLPRPDRDGQLYVEAVVNSLQKRGLSPGQAWAYYGVEIRGESRNQWGSRKGDADHKNVSDALEKAKSKLP